MPARDSVASCDWKKMEEQGIEKIAWTDAAAVCQTMAASLSRQPTIGLLDDMTKMLYVMRVSGSKEEYKDLAFQTMNIVESRDQTGDTKAIEGTLNVVMKIYNGSQGHVAPRDLSVALRRMGPQAVALSDEGMFTIGAVIFEQKKDFGE
jgi:hypothetical protein